MGGYLNSTEHLMEELGRAGLKVRIALIRKRFEDDSRSKDDFLGLYISEEEIAAHPYFWC